MHSDLRGNICAEFGVAVYCLNVVLCVLVLLLHVIVYRIVNQSSSKRRGLDGVLEDVIDCLRVKTVSILAMASSDFPCASSKESYYITCQARSANFVRENVQLAPL